MTARAYATLLRHLHTPRVLHVEPAVPESPIIAPPEDPEHPQSLVAAMAGPDGLSPTVFARCLYFAGCELLPAIEFARPADAAPREFLEFAREWLLGATPNGAALLALANRMSEAELPMPADLSVANLVCTALANVFVGGHYVWRIPGQRITHSRWLPRFVRLVPVHDVLTAEVVWADLPPVPEHVEPVVEVMPVDHPDAIGSRNDAQWHVATGRCRGCTGLIRITDDGISHHVNEYGEVDHDRDADHVAVAEVEPGSKPARRRKPAAPQPRKRKAKATHVD